ncbi:MAG: hypothetical protein ABI791_08680 [Acidobacteriota bacterium]
MSKLVRAFLSYFAAVLLILQIINNSNAQDVAATIKIDAARATADVSGTYLNDATPRKRNFYFASTAGGSSNLGERISNVKLSKADGSSVAVRQLIPGEYLADDDFSSWKYTIALSPDRSPSSSAHASWINSDTGFLMLDDILPQGSQAAAVKLVLPDSWKSVSLDQAGDASSFKFASAADAVIVIGKRIKTSNAEVDGVSLQLATSGDWLFTEAEALAMATEIYSEYRKIFGAPHAGSAQIAIARFPVQVSPGNWQAETRGRNLTIVSSDMNFRTQSLQRLHEQLRHEIFHLWLPNAVNLSGKYDWFYEGFALYQSLKTAVFMNRIGFDDFLDTLSRAYSIDSRQTKRLSLVEASKARFAGNDTQVYARGMIVAFLTDVTLMERSKGKSSVSDVLEAVFKRHSKSAPAAEGTGAVIEVLRSAGIGQEFVDRNITGSAPIEWNNELMAAGIQPPDTVAKTGLTVSPKPRGRQKALLDKLGYNNWRKLSSK